MAWGTAKAGELLIHLGNKKTGSTSLQGFLAKNQEVLDGRGVNFVSVGRRHISHNRLFRPLRTEQAAEIWREIADEVAAAPNMVHLMSSEVFFDPSIAASMVNFMPDTLKAKTRMVVYLRRQDQYLEAMYKQMTKNGRVHAVPAEYVRLAGQELGDYAAILSMFDQVAGPDTITVRRFERARLKDGDTIADFLHLLGMEATDPEFVQPGGVANETLSRAATQLLGAFARNSKLNSREIAREILRGDDKPPRRSGDVFKKLQRQEMMANFEVGNADVAARYLKDDEAELFNMDNLSDDAEDGYPSLPEEVELFMDAQEKVTAAIGRIDARNRAKLFRG